MIDADQGDGQRNDGQCQVKAHQQRLREQEGGDRKKPRQRNQQHCITAIAGFQQLHRQHQRQQGDAGIAAERAAIAGDNAASTD